METEVPMDQYEQFDMYIESLQPRYEHLNVYELQLKVEEAKVKAREVLIKKWQQYI